MNFLAHAFLAGPAPADRIGGLLGDFVKGLLPAGLPADLAAGVALHRAIDAFADRHPAFVASRARVGKKRRRVSGILVDMFYDHLLARDWTTHASGTLDAFVARLYAELPGYEAGLSANAQDIARRMRRDDWLGSYRDVVETGRIIDRMAIHRLRRPNTLSGGIEEFFTDADGFATDFRAFLPDALDFAARWRAERRA